MEEFPSQLELIAASGLLLLPISVFLHTPNSHRTHSNDDSIKLPTKRQQSGPKNNKSFTSDSVSADRSWLTSEGSSSSVQARRTRIAITSTLKVPRRRRSKIHYYSHDRRTQDSSNLKKATAPVRFKNASETTTSEASCMSSSTSDLSSTLRRREREEISLAPTREDVKGIGGEAISSNIGHRAQAIMHLLSRSGCSSEVRIRQVLGDSPDTSKALRILLRRADVKRSGAGGRSDPYIYMVSPLSRGTERPC